MLASPKFLFRVEQRSAARRAGHAYRISDLELASRLSFFLWSSIPDDELLDARRPRAAAGARPSSSGRCGGCWPIRAREALVEQLRRPVAAAAQPARHRARITNEFPDFDDNLRQAFRRETELFFDSIIREDRSVLDLLTADYTFVNERLARHYGIPNVYGSHFRRVTVTDDDAAGLLGQGSILTGHVARRPDVAGRCAASGFSRTCSARRRRRRRRTCRALEGHERAGTPQSMRERMEAAPRESGVRELPSA